MEEIIEKLCSKFLPNGRDLSTFKENEIIHLESAFIQGANVMMNYIKNERESNKESASNKKYEILGGVSGLFSAEDMENFADYVVVRYVAGYKLKYKELLKNFKRGVK